MDYILETNHITKTYGPVTALNDINLGFSDKKIYGLFGRNGAGKTTLLDIISSRIFADRGTVSCYGEDINRNPEILTSNICYIPEKHYFPPQLRIKKLLSLVKMYFPDYNDQSAERLCRKFNMNTEQKYGELARGHQSILRIIIGLAAGAHITIFDEPVLGLDTPARDYFYFELIQEFSENPRLFIISTHLIEESADLFNEVIIIGKGEIIQQAPIEELLAGAFYVSGKSNRVNEFIKNRNVLDIRSVHDIKTVVVEGDMNAEKQLPGLCFSSLTIGKLFIHLTNDQKEQE